MRGRSLLSCTTNTSIISPNPESSWCHHLLGELWTNRNWRQTSAPSIRYGLGYTLVSAHSAGGAPAPTLLI